MSDFLSNFDPDNKKKNEIKKPTFQKEEAVPTNKKQKKEAKPLIKKEVFSSRSDELAAETDLGYKKRKRIIIGSTIAGVVLCLVIGFFLYDNSVHVEMPGFVGKDMNEVQKWASEYDIEFDISSSYNNKYDENVVMDQKDKEGSRVRKGSKLEISLSKGADPEALLKLPNFQEMDLKSAEAWIKDNKAKNLKLVQEFNDEVEVKKNIKFEFKDSSITADTYKRKDHAVVYYSKGKETFKKEIKVLNFVNKTKGEVEEWAKTNLIEMTYVEVDSNTVEMGKIIDQSIVAGEKVAKKDAMSVTVSLGKASIVPNFAQYNSQQASMVPNLSVIIQYEFNASIPYGKLISQSHPAGTKFMDKDDKTVTVVYSEGAPYLKDYRSLTEGDLPKSFFEDYESKGANITYQVVYIDSDETRGVIVDMSTYNSFVPINFHVIVYVSRGN